MVHHTNQTIQCSSCCMTEGDLPCQSLPFVKFWKPLSNIRVNSRCCDQGLVMGYFELLSMAKVKCCNTHVYIQNTLQRFLDTCKRTLLATFAAIIKPSLHSPLCILEEFVACCTVKAPAIVPRIHCFVLTTLYCYICQCFKFLHVNCNVLSSMRTFLWNLK